VTIVVVAVVGVARDGGRVRNDGGKTRFASTNVVCRGGADGFADTRDDGHGGGVRSTTLTAAARRAAAAAADGPPRRGRSRDLRVPLARSPAARRHFVRRATPSPATESQSTGRRSAGVRHLAPRTG